MEIHKIFFVWLAIVSVIPIDALRHRMGNPIDEATQATNEMQAAYEASGLENSTNDFQTNSLKTVLDQEKTKSKDCKAFVNSLMQHVEDKETAKVESDDQCTVLIEDMLKDITDEKERSEAEETLRPQCKDLIASAQAEAADDERKKLELQSKCKDLFEGVLESVDSAQKKTAQLQSPEQESCTHDYSVACPDGWHEVGDGAGCEASPSYSGPCGTLSTMAGDSEEKKKFEQHCHVQWPCLSSCSRDYSILCPENWEDIGGGKCRATFFYRGRCERTYTFAALSEEEKEKWSMKCNVRWPCLPTTVCDRDYTSNCPQMWTDAGKGVCEAPEQYRGPCVPRQSIGIFDENMKAIFEKRCSVIFPCNCDATETYVGVCEETGFDGKTAEDKKQFSIKCGVRWPCVEECKRDYSEDCPLEWGKEGEYCNAPSSYEGPCEHKKKFSTYSVAMKMASQEECKVYWPCEGEQMSRPMVLGGVVETGSSSGTRQLSSLPGWMTGLQKYGHSGPINPISGFVVPAVA